MTDASLSGSEAARTDGEASRPDGAAELPAFLSGAEQEVGRETQVRDFRLGHVLARTFSILRRRPLSFLLLYGVASLLLNVPVTFTNDDSPAAAVVLAMIVAQAFYIVFNVFAGAAVVDIVIDDTRGRPVDLRKALRVGLRWFLPALGATVAMVGLAVLGFVLLIIPAAMIISRYFVVVPACVVEGLGPVQSMRRSTELTMGYRWRIFALWFAILITEIIVQMELDQAIRPSGYFSLVLASQVLWDMAVGAFAAVATAVTYRDLRIAKEGIDTDQVATVFD
ncbi:MAG TPA: hypothetical protein VHU22_01095 [Xanthobacteraceae bacterium]|nr:hypothetical protein [Xanthobacteraceae bacterium]